MRTSRFVKDSSTRRHDRAPQDGNTMDVSIVSPVHNERESLSELHRRVSSVLDRLESERGLRGEFLLVDDGSDDGSLEIIRALSAGDPRVRYCGFERNRGQYAALVAGLAMSRGAYVITLDADLQNPPEEIPRVLGALEAGHDLVVTRRARRNDPPLRRLASRLSNRLSSWIAGCLVVDHGCMMCGYRRSLVEMMCARARGFTFMRALALRCARAPVALAVAHAPRLHGSSSYGFLRLVRLQLDAASSFLRMRRERARERRSPFEERMDGSLRDGPIGDRATSSPRR
jgi:undecaprenyl-phosphate 4-deoxy-4-formamido-L-arabinose transferase